MNSKGNKFYNKIPKTGRIGRFAKIIEKAFNQEALVKIMIGSDQYISLSPVKKALWWKNAVERLEKEVGKQDAIQIMKSCGQKCCGKGQRKTAKRLMAESGSLKEFINKLGKYRVKDGELEYELINKKTIVARHNRCFCGQVKKTNAIFLTNTYCQCSVEFNKQFFEAALEKTVEVQLVHSILNGSDHCEFNIVIGVDQL